VGVCDNIPSILVDEIGFDIGGVRTSVILIHTHSPLVLDHVVVLPRRRTIAVGIDRCTGRQELAQ
jgi:hypothetical protein